MACAGRVQGGAGREGGLTSAELVRLLASYFSDGLVVGGKEFVEKIFGQHREKFGPRRKDGAQRIAESADGLFALRRLRRRPLMATGLTK